MARTGFIYKVVCNISNLTYVGSTFTAKLSVRLAHHRGHYKQFLKGKGNYITSFQIIERGDYNIHLIETVQVDTIYELRLKERYYFDILPCINRNRPILLEGEKKELEQQYTEDNKQNKKEYDLNYRTKNRETINVNKKIYRENNRETIKEKKKIYNEKNREKINEQARKYNKEHKDEKRICDKKYREANKDEINRKKKKNTQKINSIN